ncbi:MAG: putative drug exporter of the superfamily [Actinomycetota bacterium]|nr:putative drug exporter of the superfamily [Actinomycetota bacterium]
MLERLADWCYRRRWQTVGLWVIALVLSIGLSGAIGGDFHADFSAPKTDSTAAFKLLDARFPAQGGHTIDVVYKAKTSAADPSVKQQIDALVAKVKTLPLVDNVTPSQAPSQNPAIGALSIQLVDTGTRGDPDKTSVLAIVDVIRAANVPSQKVCAAGSAACTLQVEAGGQAVAQTEGASFGSSGLGFIAAIIILLVAFGSLLAAGLPILSAFLGLGIGTGVMMLLCNVIDVPSFAPQMADMIGIGVGIDYALFILTRYRSGLRDGLEPRDAVVVAVNTAGRAVLFAGATVVIALLGLMLMGLSFLYGLAVSVSLTVLIMMVLSITLLPAMLGFVGRTIDRLHIPFVKRADAPMEDNLAHRWSRVVQRFPWPAALVSLVVLLALAAPLFSMRLGFPDAGNGNPDLTSRRAYDLQTAAFGKGSNGRLIVVADTKSPQGLTALATASSLVGKDPDVAFVSPPQPSPTGDAAIAFVVPKSGPQDKATEDLVHRIRNDIVPVATNGSTVGLHVGGLAAVFVDQNKYLLHRLPYFIGAVVLLSFLLLMVVFRSVLVPVKAAVMNLLSIGAAYGVVSMATSGGWVSHLIGIKQATPVPGFVPMMMFAILFGLSMDYEVFLLSRVREEYVRTGDNATAVAEGLAQTARVITAAAAIMVCIFAAFILGDQVFVKMVGLGLATAIFVDASVVRMVLVPATMELLGDRNWWFPAWLDRITPHISFEGQPKDLDAELAAVLGEAPERV